MIKGDRFKLFGHTMEVQLRKESLDFVRYDLMCICCSYPRNFVIEAPEKLIEEIQDIKLCKCKEKNEEKVENT